MGRVAALLAAGLVSLAQAAEISLDNVWLRPAVKGQPDAAVYVDIRSSEALKLVGARSAAATRIELVQNTMGGDPNDDSVVKALPVAANGTTRLALHGNYLRMKDITQDLSTGAKAPIELTFVDANARTQTATADALVRGLLPRPSPIAPPYLPGPDQSAPAKHRQ